MNESKSLQRKQDKHYYCTAVVDAQLSSDLHSLLQILALHLRYDVVNPHLGRAVNATNHALSHTSVVPHARYWHMDQQNVSISYSGGCSDLWFIQ